MAVATIYPDSEQGKRKTSLEIKEVGISAYGLYRASHYNDQASEALITPSPWQKIQIQANCQLGTEDKSGMSPWWILDGATIERIIFRTPASEDAGR